MGAEATEEPAMAEIVVRRRGELSDMLELIRRAGGGVVFEEFPGDLEENTQPPAEAGPDRAGEARDACGVAQRMLIDEANRLAETLDRFRRGECSIREETGDLVAAAPLHGPRNVPAACHHSP